MSWRIILNSDIDGNMQRRGIIYKELQRNIGGKRGGELSGNRYVRGVGLVMTSRWRWVAEITWHCKRYRFRSTNYSNARFWLDCMIMATTEDDEDFKLRKAMRAQKLAIRYPKNLR